MVVQSLFNNLPMDLKLSRSLSFVSMRIRDSRVKCFCLFIRISFLPGGNSHIYKKDFNRKFGKTKFHYWGEEDL